MQLFEGAVRLLGPNGLPIQSSANNELKTTDADAIAKLAQLVTANGQVVTKEVIDAGGVGILGHLSTLSHELHHLHKSLFTQHGEVPIAGKSTLISLLSRFPLSAVRDKVTVASGGSVSQVNAEYVVTTGAQANSTADLRSRERGSYVCGLGAMAEVSCRMPTVPVGQQFGEWGYFDDNDGFGFGVEPAGVYVFHQSAGVKTKISQADWNVDKIDGTTHSGVMLTMSLGNVFVIDLTYFGYGIVEWTMLIQDDSGRQRKVVVHRYKTDGALNTQNPNMPLRVRTSNGTATTAFSLVIGGRAFSVLGNYAPYQRLVSHTIGAYALASTTAPQYVMTIRHKDTASFNAIRCMMQGIDTLTASKDVDVQMVMNPTFGGSAQNYVTPSGMATGETACEIDATSGVTVTGGIELMSVLVASQGRSDTVPADWGNVILTPGDTFAVMVTNLSGGTSTIRFGSRWYEDW